MGYLVVRTRWPSESTPEVLKMAIENVKKYPADDSLGEAVVPNAISSGLHGYKTFSVTLFKEGKLEALQRRLMASMAMYAPIPGFEYKFETWATVEEAYVAIGQSPPG